MSNATSHAALDSARSKAFWRVLPILFFCYVVAYVDRQNVGIAKLTMSKDMPAFDNAVIGFGMGIFFWGYFLLEIPGSLLVEKWSARKWICRIMVTWGITASLTALVKTPFQFYVIRFLLGLAEAGFFPGVVVYLTHWFPNRDRSKALSYFLVATPFAQIVSPKLSNLLLPFGTTEVINGVAVHHPELLGLKGWQWIYIAWGIPAVILGVIVLWYLTDRPKNAKWLTPEERDALEAELEKERTSRSAGKRMTLKQAFTHPKVLILTLAYFCVVNGSQAMEFFLPSILDAWYKPKYDLLTWLLMLPALMGLLGQLFVGWSSDRNKERRFHTCIPIFIGALVLALTPATKGHLALSMVCFMIVFAGFKAYLPAFWTLPSTFLTHTAAAGSIGLINSFGNLGGFFGPTVLGWVQKRTGSFEGGIYYLSTSMCVSALIILFLNLGRKEGAPSESPVTEPASTSPNATPIPVGSGK
jgi:ACS family tartrate transporter-like MFS transporter